MARGREGKLTVGQERNILEERIRLGIDTPEDIARLKTLQGVAPGSQELISNLAKIGQAAQEDIVLPKVGEVTSLFPETRPGTIEVSAQQELENAILAGASQDKILEIVQRRGIQQQDLQTAINKDAQRMATYNALFGAGVSGTSLAPEIDPSKLFPETEVFPGSAPLEPGQEGPTDPNVSVEVPVQYPILPGPISPPIGFPQPPFPGVPGPATPPPLFGPGLPPQGLFPPPHTEEELFEAAAAKEKAELEAAIKAYLEGEERQAPLTLKAYEELFAPSVERNIRRGADIFGARGLGTSGFEGSGAIQELVRKASQESSEKAGLAGLEQLLGARSKAGLFGLEAAQIPSMYRRAGIQRKLSKSDLEAEHNLERKLGELSASTQGDIAKRQRSE